MNGPVTLLAQPHYNRYIDSEGEHVMPWVSDQSLAGLPVEGDTVIADSVPVAFSNFKSFGGFSVEFFPTPASLAGYNDIWTWLTVTNGSKSYAYPSSAGMGGAVSEFLSTRETSYMGLMARTNLNVATGVKILASASPLTFSITAPADLPAFTVFVGVVVLANLASSPRTFRFTKNGTPIGRTYSIPAKTWACIRLNGYGSIEASNVIGVTSSDIVAGESVYLAYFGLRDGGEMLAPVPLDIENISEIQENNDIGEWGDIVPWAGTARQSKAQEGTRYWKIAVDRNHFPNEVEGEIVSRWLPYGWPATSTASPINIERQGVHAFDPDYGTNYPETYHPAFLAFYPDYLTTGSIVMLVAAEWNEYPDKTGVDTIGDTAGKIDPNYTRLTVPVPAAPWDDFMTASMRWNAHEVIMENEGVVLFQNTRTKVDGRDFPFLGIEPTEYGDPDAVYLYSGLNYSSFSQSQTWNRDVAVFNRNLTDEERAFVSDPDAFWNVNMFAEPKSATITGLTGIMYEGDTALVTIQVNDVSNDPVPLYGHKVWFTVKYTGDDDTDDSEAVEQLTAIFAPDGTNTGSGIEAYNLAEGMITTSFAFPAQSCKYDVQVEDVNGHIHTVAYGLFTPIADVTKAS